MENVKKPVVLDGEYYIFECPHCNELASVHVNFVSCMIFRHGSYYQLLPDLPFVNGLPQYMPTEPINPHTPKEICDRLVAEKKILGCGKPFRFVYGSAAPNSSAVGAYSPEGNFVVTCDYV